jgi:sulfur carrier protein ThiS
LIEIELRVFGELRNYIEKMEIGESRTVRCDDGSTAKDILSRLGIPETEAKIILVNGRAKEVDDKLNDGDRLAIFPAVAGG